MARAHQSELAFSRRGGRREGAGRKPTGPRRRVPHVQRPKHLARHPLHVTWRLADGLPCLRAKEPQRILQEILHTSRERHGLRIVHFSAQRDHLHLVCEAEDQNALTTGMRSLGVRLAAALNALWQRTGSLIGDRYHARALTSPREVRNVLLYLFKNATKHGERIEGLLDRCSSAPSFDGWKELTPVATRPTILAHARTWLLAIGWKRHGPLPIRGP